MANPIAWEIIRVLHLVGSRVQYGSTVEVMVIGTLDGRPPMLLPFHCITCSMCF